MESYLQPGELLADCYRIERKIGEGGFGAVYLARHTHMDREVAIKTLRRKENPFLPDLVQRFEREVKLARKLEHPNIVRLYDHGHTPEGVLFMAMEYVRGQELELVLRTEQRLPLDRATHIMQQILDGLAEAHSLGIVHRDLKPSNVMLTRSGLRSDVVKLLDFGVAKAFDGTYDDLTAQNLMQGVGFGTPQYMAPEQILGQNIGPHTDLYAVGLIYLELVTGVTVMLTNDPTLTIQKQLEEEVPVPEWLAKSPLADVFSRSLAKDWKERFQSAAEMYQAIDEQVRGKRRSLLASIQPPKAPATASLIAEVGGVAGESVTVDSAPTIASNNTPTSRSDPDEDLEQSGPTVIVQAHPGIEDRLAAQPTEVVAAGAHAHTAMIGPQLSDRWASASPLERAAASAYTQPTVLPGSIARPADLPEPEQSGSRRAVSPTGPVVTVAPIPGIVLLLGGLAFMLFVVLVITLALL